MVSFAFHRLEYVTVRVAQAGRLTDQVIVEVAILNISYC
jgi:hypothetical protein